MSAPHLDLFRLAREIWSVRALDFDRPERIALLLLLLLLLKLPQPLLSSSSSSYFFWPATPTEKRLSFIQSTVYSLHVGHATALLLLAVAVVVAVAIARTIATALLLVEHKSPSHHI